MPVVRLLLAYWPVVALFVVVGPAMWLSLRQKPGQKPAESLGRSSVYSRCGVPVEVEESDLAWWALLPAEDQEAYDTAVLDLGEQADLDARYAAREAADDLVYRAQVNARFHP